ncbi:ATP-binding protein [Kineosporia babensis]|uniref:ATP-binding protein n=1 Tax=Kineosporia babensis TaxID=499548 RepID=A0A9X1NKU3_9ACTN|nr:ATP-binding protein [Kineosporia babensis]MCD5315935.1 ATP-binding protein [Kineosporia babensis]
MSDSYSAAGLLTAAGDTLPVFERLDLLLAQSVEQARNRFGAEVARDAFRGLYLNGEEMAAALERPAGTPLRPSHAFPLPTWDQLARNGSGWAWLRGRQGLSEAELDVVLIALAPEVDLRYERLYGYLQDDVNRRRPSVDLALDLICRTPAEKLQARDIFSSAAPLRERLLLRLEAGDAPLLARPLRLDPQVVHLLLNGRPGLDEELAPYCRYTLPDRLPEEALKVLDSRTAQRRHLVVRCTDAAAVAGHLGKTLLTLEADRLPTDDDIAVARAFREAELGASVLHIESPAALGAGSRGEAALVRGLSERSGVTVLTGSPGWSPPGPLGVLEVAGPGPDRAARRAAWAGGLEQAGHPQAARLSRELADRFSFGPDRIAAAVADAVIAAGPEAVPDDRLVFARARRQTGQRLAGLARHIEPGRTRTDLVLPASTTQQLEQLTSWVRLRVDVFESWGYGRRLGRGRGVSALFTGPPGTGKTTAAEVLAAELGVDLYAVDLSAVVSKYIGETEKNLEQIFTAAAEADAVLLFDEADALFGKRAQVQDAHDRYANIETSYLLQRMEHYDGIAILATNLREHLDEAFTRRLRFVIDFPFPDEHLRAGIWKVSFPDEVPIDPALDLPALGIYRLSGAEIASAALHASFLAAARGTPVDTAAVSSAIWYEFHKAGRIGPANLPAAEGR